MARVEDAPSLRNEPEPFQVAVDVLRRPRRDDASLHREIRRTEMNLNQERLEATADPAPLGSLTTRANTSRVARNAEEMHQRPRREPLLHKSRASAFVYKLLRRGSARGGLRGDREEAGGVSEGRTTSGRLRPPVEAPSSYFQSQIRQVVDIFVHREEERPSYKMSVEAEPYFAAMNVPKRLRSATLRGLIENHQIDLSRKTRAEQKAFLKRLAASKLKEGKGRRDDRVEMPALTPEEMSLYAREMKRVDAVPEREEAADRSTSVSTVRAEIHPPPPDRPRETAAGPKLGARRRTYERRAADDICVDEIRVLDAAEDRPSAGDADRDRYKYLPSRDGDIDLMGEEYVDEMIDSFLATNSSLDLKIGENIFCTLQSDQDMLCFAHAAITALMNLDSIRHAASLTDGPIGEALTSFCRPVAEPERHGLVRWLAGEIFDDAETAHPKAQDAAVFTRKLLERLASEGRSGATVFSQDLEVSSCCPRCGGERKSRRLEVMSAVQEGTYDSREGSRGCVMGESCTDGETRVTSLLNRPDAVLKLNARRRDPRTYGENAEIPYDIRCVGGVTYSLKCCVVHLGRAPSAGHFVTVLTNPLDREQCVLVDDGKVRRIEREHFRKFAEMSYIVGYERTDLRTTPKPSAGDILGKIDARRREIRRRRAVEHLAFLRSLAEETSSVEAVIEQSYDPAEAKVWLTRMLRRRIHTEPLLIEEIEANAAADALHRRFMSYQQSRSSWSLLKRLKSRFGLYTNRDGRKIAAASEGLVLGSGLRDKSSRLPKHAVITEKEDPLGGSVHVYRCSHGCDDATEMSKREMLEHIERVHVESRRCRVLRRIDANFKITPRKIARGVWSNGRFRLRVLRRHDRGNRTQYAWDDGAGRKFSCVVQTSSTTQLEDEHNRGEETEDGYRWYGRGYSGERKNQLVVAKEEVMYNRVSERHANFPVWSVLCQVYDVKGWTNAEGDREETAGVNLDVWSHPAANPANLKLATEFEMTLVASADEDEPHKMVLRRPNQPDEELTRFEELSYAEETPAADEDILRSLADHRVRQEVSKAHLPEFEQSWGDTYDADVTFKFVNGGRKLCWVNAATQALLRTGPNIGTQLRRVLQQPSHFSGARDVPKMMWEIAGKASEAQVLEGLRDMLAPGMQEREGSALMFFEGLLGALRLEGVAFGKRVYMPSGCCPAKGCDKTLPSSEKLVKRKHLQIEHRRTTDDRSPQKAIDRTFSLQEGPHPVTCSDGHTTSARKTVTITERPDLFVLAACGSLDQESSMEVELGGAKYQPAAVIHHLQARTEGGVGHHYCSLKDRKTGKWSLVNDYGAGGWNTSYRFDETEQALKAGGRKLFDDLCFVVYERTVAGEEGDAAPREDGPNFHRVTTSGQQALTADNSTNQCYAIAPFAMLLSNPYVHHFFRSLPAQKGTELETFLRGLCHRPDHSVEPDIERSRRLVFEEHARHGLLCEDFRQPRQQDAEEFLHALMRTMCIEGIEDDDGVVVMEGPLSKTHRQNFREIMGFTSRSRTTCAVDGCGKRSHSNVEHQFVLQLAISADSVNGCIREEVGKTKPTAVKQCEICGKQDVTWHVTQTDVLPKKCVMIQLKRFTAGNQKITTPVAVDVELTEGAFSGYRLTGAVLHHEDRTQSGHYTHILRDVEDGGWVSTDDRRRSVLTEDEATNKLITAGYILLYSRPDRFPPALKAGKAAGRDAETESTGTEESERRRSRLNRPQNSSTFKTREAEDSVSLPRTPATADPTPSRGIVSPSADEIAEKCETRTATPRVIDPADPLARLLKERFGHDDFRSREQMAAVREVVDGVNDVLVIMSTGEERCRMRDSRRFAGSGKSLIYQLAALQMNKLAVIVGPLLSLADNQVDRLNRNGIQARLLNHQVRLSAFRSMRRFSFRRYAAYEKCVTIWPQRLLR